MKKNNIDENIEIKEKINFLNNEMVRKKRFSYKKINLNTLFIYLNLIIIYCILFKYNKKSNKDINHNKYNNQKIITLEDYIFSGIPKKYQIIVNKYRRKWIQWPIPNEIIFKPLMSKIDLIAFCFFMKQENIYFEFGSGGSTNIASIYKLKTYSVESDKNWHENLKRNGILANYITIDLKGNSFGYPGNNTNVTDWKKYIQAYKKEYNADIIFIDGRFRVACALDIYSKIRDDTLILIHDYVSRKKYNIIEKYYIKLKFWDSLALFIKNTQANPIKEDEYNRYLKEKYL